MSLLKDVDDLIANHRETVRATDLQLADAKRQRDALRAERDAFYGQCEAEIVHKKQVLAAYHERIQALSTNPFPAPRPVDAFHDWRDWARHHLVGLTLHDIKDALLLTLDDAATKSQQRSVAIVVAYDQDDEDVRQLVASTAALGAVVVSPHTRGCVGAPHGMCCAPTHLLTALCTLCADAPSTISHLVGADSIRGLMHDLIDAEASLAQLVHKSL